MKRRLWKKPFKIGLIVMAVGLITGLVLPGIVAADEAGQTSPPARATTLKGKVVSIATDKTSFSIKSGDQTIAIKVDGNTRYYQVQLPLRLAPLLKRLQEGKGPKSSRDVERGLGLKKGKVDREAVEDEDVGLAQGEALLQQLEGKLRPIGAKATFDDIAVDDTVLLRVMPNENLAKLVLIVKASVIGRVQGMVSAVSGSSITILRADATTVVLSWDANTRFVLKGLISVQPGQIAIATYNTKTMKAIVVQVNPPSPPTTPATST